MSPAPSANRRKTIGSLLELHRRSREETAGDVALASADLLSSSVPLRRSVSDASPPTSGYSNSLSDLDFHIPPSYDEECSSLPPARFKILPREEEGREELPSYTCSLHKEAVFERKMELRNPFQRADRRRWRKCYFVLHGTQLSIYKARRAPPFANPKDISNDDQPAGWEPGELVTKYTLQLAEVGVAADYRKRHFVIRVRAQTDQFLFSCRNLDAFVDWLEALSAGIDLSLALEERSLPRYQTIPRRRRRRQPAQIVNEQEAIIRHDFPHLVDNTLAARNTLRHRRYETTSAIDVATLRSGMIQAGFVSGNLVSAPRSVSAARTPNRCSSATTQEQALLVDGKWAPPHTLTNEANLRYAKRCMAVLCNDSPRQSEYVVVDGKRYRLCWEKQEMTPVIPDETKPVASSEERTIQFSCPSLIKLVRHRSDAGHSKEKAKASDFGDGGSKGKQPANLPPLPEYEEIVDTPNSAARLQAVMLR